MSYIFLYPSFVYFYEYNYITFIFYEILYPTVSTFVIAIFPNLTIKTEILQVERNLNRSNIIFTPCLVLVIESIFFHRQQRIQFPSLRNSAPLSLYRVEIWIRCIAIHEMPASQPRGDRATTPTTMSPSLNPLSTRGEIFSFTTSFADVF